MIRCKKIYKSCCTILLLVYFIFNSIILLRLYLKRTSLDHSIIEDLQTDIQSEENLKTQKAINLQELYATHSWMFNNRVYQYSSNLLVENGKPVRVESMILSRGEFKENAVKKDFRCVIKSIKGGDKVEKEIYLKVTRVFIFVSNTKRVKCDIDRDVYIDYDDIAVAIINTSDYKLSSMNFTENDIKSNFFKLPKNMLHYQKPRIIKVPIVKKTEVSHCVHYTYGIAQQDIEKIDKWLEFQKKIGVTKIVFYDANAHTLLEESFQEKYDNNFLEIRPYQIHFEAICNLTRLNYYKQIDLIRYQVMKDQCEDAFYNVFNNPIFSAKNRWNHQKITSNDCYSSLENVYEFVSYYDFDEIIFPRMNGLGNDSSSLSAETCEINKLCDMATNLNNNNTQNLYSYFKTLVLRHLDSFKKLGSLYFTNGFYLEPSYYVNKLMTDLHEVMIKNKTYFHQPVNSVKNAALKVHLNLKHKYGHFFTILPQDLDYIKKLYDSYLHMKCIFENYNQRLDANFDSSFKRFLFLATNNKHQMGKSVHFTDNVDAVFTHYATIMKPGSKTLNLKIDEGVLSHFRNDLFHLARQLNSSITNLKIDSEYYMHLVSNHSSICLK
jgi:hypothetical protein